jgi:hypothetical protein
MGRRSRDFIESLLSTVQNRGPAFVAAAGGKTGGMRWLTRDSAAISSQNRRDRCHAGRAVKCYALGATCCCNAASRINWRICERSSISSTRLNSMSASVSHSRTELKARGAFIWTKDDPNVSCFLTLFVLNYSIF